MTSPLVTAAELAEHRADAAAMMLDTCLVRRPTGHTTQNETSGLEEPVYTTVVASSPCKVTAGSDTAGDLKARTIRIGGVERPVIVGGVHLPVTDDDISDHDEIVITAIGPHTDPTVLGAVYQVVEYAGKSWATARRINVVKVG